MWYKRINFGEPGRFKVNKYNIRSRKTICPKYEYEDYGIDEDTQRFIIVEFYDQKDDLFAIGSCCCIFTLNSKGQFGTSDIPFDYELDGAYDFAINNMTDKILQYINNNF